MAIENVSISDSNNVARTILADQIGSDYAQVFKICFGQDGTLTLVEASTGLPVQIVAALPAGANVIGKVDVNSAIPTGANVIGKVDVNSALPAGANVLGKVDINSALPAGSALIGQADLNSVPASARTTDSNAIANAVDVLMDNLTQLTVKKAFANVGAGSTDSSIVAAVSTKKIHVVSFRLHCGGTATNVTFNSKPAGAGTAISETFALGVNGGRAEAYNPVGHFWSNTGEGLTVTTTAGSVVGVGVVYVEKS